MESPDPTLGTYSLQRFDAHSFARFVLKHAIIGFFETPLLLKSGRQTFWYVNWRVASSDAYLLDMTGAFVASFLQSKGISADCVIGVPEGATKIGVLSSLHLARKDESFGPGSHCVPMGRGAAKSHGKPEDRLFVGFPRGKTVVLEDVTTTGGSLLSFVSALRNSGVDVCAALTLTNREDIRDDGLTVAQAFTEQFPDIPFYSLSFASELVPLALAQSSVSDDVRQAVSAELGRHAP